MAPGQKQRGVEVECEEAFAQAGERDRGRGVASLAGRADDWRAAWKATCCCCENFKSSIVSPDGREARGSAGAAVQPREVAQFRKTEVVLMRNLSRK